MIKDKLTKLRKLFNLYGIDGYIIPKNDAYFSEFSSPDRLKYISNFSGSAGQALILRNKSYLLVDGRYTIQAELESGKEFKICEIPNFSYKQILKKFNKKLIIGFDPQLFTNYYIHDRLRSYFKLIPIEKNLVDKIILSKDFVFNNNVNRFSFKMVTKKLIKYLEIT